MATQAGFVTFRRVYNDPETFLYKQQFENWNNRYALLWSYYLNSCFDDLTKWGAYRSYHRLYRFTRSIYNPTRRLVDFYTGTIYPGVLTADAKRFEDGTVVAIPFAANTNKQLIAAIASLWKWSNWHVNKNIMVRYGACLGECLVEVIDDIEKGHIEFQVQHPGRVYDLQLDFRGNVKAYTIQYDYEDQVEQGFSTGRTYEFRKVVDTDTIRYYRDGIPFNYGMSQHTYDNPYGFVPAVWVKHVDVGSSHGEPAMRNMSKFDEINSLASHVVDQAHRVLNAPVLVSGDNIQPFNPELPADGEQMSAMKPDGGRGNIPMIKATIGARIDAVQPPAGESLQNMDRMLTEIEKDHPELTMYHEMRKMSQVTGPAVSRLFGDVDISINEARTNYDTQMVKLHQMAIAIGGMRVNEGDWGSPSTLNKDQSVFLPFDLESYAEGDLDFEIATRPLVPLGQWETIQARRAEIALAREEVMLKQLEAAPLGAPGNQPAPQGALTMQIGNRLRMASATEGALQTNNPPKAPSG